MTKFKEKIKPSHDEIEYAIRMSNYNANYFREKIKVNKISKFSYFSILLICVFALLVTCIITLNYQTSLVNKKDKIYDALFYNYYQRTQFNYLYSVVLSIFYKLVNITESNNIDDNKKVLYFIGKNIEKSHQLFFRYYMDFKMDINENFSKLYEPLESHKITINWENIIFNNDYNTELALILYRILDCNEHEFNQNDIKDCNHLLLDEYLTIDRKGTPVYGNFIKLAYYFYMNFHSVIKQFFYSLEDSFDESLKNYSKRTSIVYIILEVIALLSFLSFFGINLLYIV
jgi:hypothetical protein